MDMEQLFETVEEVLKEHVGGVVSSDEFKKIIEDIERKTLNVAVILGEAIETDSGARELVSAVLAKASESGLEIIFQELLPVVKEGCGQVNFDAMMQDHVTQPPEHRCAITEGQECVFTADGALAVNSILEAIVDAIVKAGNGGVELTEDLILRLTARWKQTMCAGKNPGVDLETVLEFLNKVSRVFKVENLSGASPHILKHAKQILADELKPLRGEPSDDLEDKIAKLNQDLVYRVALFVVCRSIDEEGILDFDLCSYLWG